MLTLEDIKKAVAQVAPGYPVERVFLFGSYAEGYADESSDVDIIVSTTKTLNLFELSRLESELADILNKEVDVMTQDSFERSDLIVEKVEMLYERQAG